MIQSIVAIILAFAFFMLFDWVFRFKMSKRSDNGDYAFFYKGKGYYIVSDDSLTDEGFVPLKDDDFMTLVE